MKNINNITLYQDDLPDDLDLGDSIAIDSETLGLNIKRDKLCLIQISSGDGSAHLVQFQNNYDAPNLKKILTNDKILKIFHFARFDIAVLQYYLNIKMNNFYCTKIASKLVRTYTDFHGLKDLCNELIKQNISKKEQSSNWNNNILSEAQLKYAASDVLYLHKLKDKLDEMIKKTNRTQLAQKCFEFLSTRVELDILGWQELDIFHH